MATGDGDQTTNKFLKATSLLDFQPSRAELYLVAKISDVAHANTQSCLKSLERVLERVLKPELGIEESYEALRLWEADPAIGLGMGLFAKRRFSLAITPTKQTALSLLLPPWFMFDLMLYSQKTLLYAIFIIRLLGHAQDFVELELRERIEEELARIPMASGPSIPHRRGVWTLVLPALAPQFAAAATKFYAENGIEGPNSINWQLLLQRPPSGLPAFCDNAAIDLDHLQLEGTDAGPTVKSAGKC